MSNKAKINKLAKTNDIKTLLNNTEFINLMKEESHKIFNSKKVSGYDFDDLFQDLFLNKYSSLLNFDKNKSKFSSYLYRVISFRIIEIFRKNKSHSEKVRNYKTIKNTLILPNFSDCLLDIIKRKLYHFEYKIFHEYYIMGFKYKEIAKINKVTNKYIEITMEEIYKKIRRDAELLEHYEIMLGNKYTPNLCEVKGCDEISEANGLCMHHYRICKKDYYGMKEFMDLKKDEKK